MSLRHDRPGTAEQSIAYDAGADAGYQVRMPKTER